MTEGQIEQTDQAKEKTTRLQDPRDQINLAELVEDTATSLVAALRKDYQGKIRQMLLKLEQLDKEITDGEKQLNKKRQAFTKIQARIDKLRDGDWSVLKDNDQNKKKE